MAWTGERERCAGAARHRPAAMIAKEKGPRGLAVQPKSREETPKVGTPWWFAPDHSAAVDMGVFVLRCNLGQGMTMHLGKNVARGQHELRPYGNARALQRPIALGGLGGWGWDG
jgi:hypothetical protein